MDHQRLLRQIIHIVPVMARDYNILQIFMFRRMFLVIVRPSSSSYGIWIVDRMCFWDSAVFRRQAEKGSESIRLIVFSTGERALSSHRFTKDAVGPMVTRFSTWSLRTGVNRNSSKNSPCPRDTCPSQNSCGVDTYGQLRVTHITCWKRKKNLLSTVKYK